MAATVDIYEWNGSLGSQASANKTGGTLRFKKTDNANVDTEGPIPVPTSGVERSMEKWLRCHIGATGTGAGGQITNLKMYTSGSVASGTTVYVRTTNPSAYATPVIPASDASGTDATSYTTGSPKSLGVVNAGPYTGNTIDFGDYFVMWMTVGTLATAPQNPTPTLTVTVAYDEI